MRNADLRYEIDARYKVQGTRQCKIKYFALGWSMTLHSALMYFITTGLVADGLNVVIPSFEAA